MCSTHQYRHTRCGQKKKKSAEATRQEFYRNLIVFLAVNFYFLFINESFDSWYWVTFFWGLSILSQYNKAKWALDSDTKPNDDDDIVPPPPPKWKDKDLV
jgi:hypothetical protein